MSASLHVASHEIPYVQELLRLGTKEAERLRVIVSSEHVADMWINDQTQDVAKRLIDELEACR